MGLVKELERGREQFLVTCLGCLITGDKDTIPTWRDLGQVVTGCFPQEPFGTVPLHGLSYATAGDKSKAAGLFMIRQHIQRRKRIVPPLSCLARRLNIG